MSTRQIITHRKLPHWYVPGAAHFVTYRLAGTIPAEVIQRLRDERAARIQRSPPAATALGDNRERAHKLFFADYDRYLDENRAIAWLSQPPVAALIRENLYHHQGKLYHLLAYSIMPNHVHVLLQPTEPLAGGPDTCLEPDETTDARSPLASIMHSLKSYTAHRANELLGRSGQFWQHESYDHWVRDEDELGRIVAYICTNPVKAQLVAEPYLWLFSSAHDRFLQDGSTSGWLPLS